MAANTLASIAAATAAGYGLERTASREGVSVTRLKKHVSGVPGQKGQEIVWHGESSVSSAAADTAALLNLNTWRNNRYGSDSAAASLSQVADAAASPSTQGVAPTLRAMTKDRD